MTCLRLSLLLTMMNMMIFATASLHPIFPFYEDELNSNDPPVYHPPPLKKVWLGVPENWAFQCEVEKFCCITEHYE